MDESEHATEESSNPHHWFSHLLDRFDEFHARFEGPNTIGNNRTFWAVFWGIFAILLVYPMIVNTFVLKTNTSFFIWVILALSLSIVWGYSGIFNFGQMATFGLGGYAYGVVAINLTEMIGGTVLALLIGVVLPAVVMAALGYFMFYGQVSGLYVAIITLVVTLMFNLLLTRTSGTTIGDAQLGGLNGMSGIPTLELDVVAFSFDLTPVSEYYLVLALMIAVYLGLRYTVNSYYGYVMIAIREDERRTQMFGYDIRKLKTALFSAGAALGGLAGVLYVSWSGFIDPTMFGLVSASLPIIWVTVGGRGTLLGSGIAAYLLQYTSNELGAMGTGYSFIFLGILFILVILFFPSGIVPALRDRWVAWSTTRKQSGSVQEGNS
ncbi:ABC transporter permease subunit [Natrarchaeobius oligotrophus]|uniref:Urea ABC transporter permease n=1 Tax=Natrarchaeobius chitinivorans TaxID=1679083 RepID=A0A3N6MN94_NATCH|nr:urea ABC transporter permease [Natrarchaeobius chitinivorans]RQG98950.1 urea ABC transporter permease [Natrarchaeobius chitinivorans]